MKKYVMGNYTFGHQGFLALLALSLTACAPGGDTTDAGPGDGGDAGGEVVSCDAPPVLTNDDVNGGITLDGECYRVNAKLTVADGVLRVEPGVTITFGPGAGLAVSANGALSAVGTEEEPIVLTGAVAERGHWMGLHIADSDSPDNLLEHVVLEHAGSAGWHGGAYSRAGIFTDNAGSRLTVRHSVLRDNGQAGLIAVHGGARIVLEDVLFESNEAPLWLAPNLVGNLQDLSFADNDHAYVLIAPHDVGAVSDAQTWPSLEVPYRVRSRVDVQEKLTLAPGVEIRFEQDKGLDISGTGRLSAVGTSEAPITLRGVEAEKGFWKGLHFVDTRSSDNVLDHVVLEDAGSSGWHGGAYSRAGIHLDDAGVALTVKNSTFRRNAQAAIIADHDEALLTVEGSTFEDNDAPLWLQANVIGGVAADNTFINESDVRVGVRGTEVKTSQTWQALGVPYRIESTVHVSGALTLSAGSTLTFAQNIGLEVNAGRLIADARGGQRITFTAAGGETLAGYWRGVYFLKSFSTENVIANADILYGGSSGWHGGDSSRAGIFLRGGNDRAAVALHDVHIAHSGSYGISVEESSQVDPCEGVTFANNTDADIETAGTVTVTCGS